MRIASIRLQPYGRFEDAQFAFARCATGPDIHLIVGRNEAGKTTLKHALAHLLFGVPGGSPYLYSSRRPKLSGLIEAAGERLELTRVGTGTGAKPAQAADALKQHLASLGMSRAAFFAARAFSHAEMRDAAQSLKSSGGDLHTLLMQGASGLEAALSLQANLTGEEASLYSADKRRNNRFRTLEGAWQKAADDYAAHELATPQYDTLRREVDRCEAAIEALRLEHAEAVETRTALERTIAAEPIIAELDDAEETLARVGEAVLAPGAVERVQALLGKVAETKAQLKPLDEQLKDLAGAQEKIALSQDESARLARDIITDLVERRAAFIQLDARCRDATTSAQRAAAVVLARAREMGIGPGVLGDDKGMLDAAIAVANTIPPIKVRRDLAALGQRHEALALKVRTAKDACDALDRRERPAVVAGPSEALRSAARQFDGLGNFDADRKRLLREEEDARQTQEAASRAAADDEDCLNPPPPEVGAQHEAAIAAARERLSRTADQKEAAAESLRHAQEAVHAHDVSQIPTASVIKAEREARDELFCAIAAGKKPIASAASAYQALVGKADQLADERFDKIELVVAVEGAQRALSLANDRYQRECQKLDRAQSEYDETVGSWENILRAKGFAAVPVDYGAWYHRRQKLQDAASALALARDRRAAHEEELQRAAAAARAALGVSAPGPLDEPLNAKALFGALTEEMTAQTEAAAAAREAVKAHERAMADRPRLVDLQRAAQDALKAWQDRWDGLVAQARLAPETEPDGLSELLGAFEAIDGAHGDIGRAKATIAEAQTFLATLGADAHRLAARLGERLGEDDPWQTVITGLEARLAAADDAAKTAVRLDEEHRAVKTRRDAVLDALRRDEARLAADRAAAGLGEAAPHEAVLSAARRSDERIAAHTKRAELMSALGRLSLTPEAARAALNADTPAARRAALETHTARVADLEAGEKAAIAEHATCREALRNAEALSRPGTATEARFKQRVLEADMADTVAEAIRRRCEALILNQAITAFSQDNKSPILTAAADIFRAITAGAYDRLDVGDGLTVTAHRTHDDMDVSVDGLSDGTRDQLVLSVRLAAAAGTAVPFIADDLFVNADDERAGAGLRALGDLGRNVQVFYLTHHTHIADLARDVLGPTLNVVELDGTGSGLTTAEP
ncbi:MAG: AAA family ATPase [Pseudomonadota bacterium]